MNEAISQKSLKILLRGYYGWGNFGDDLLMTISYRLLREWFPNAAIYISTSSHRTNYIKNLIGDVPVLHQFGSGGNFDLILRGGGGVFFDFKKGNTRHRIINTLIRGIGVKKAAHLQNTLKHKTGKTPLTADYRCGLGIGVGTYTPDSSKFYYSATELSLQDLLLVRDSRSESNARKIVPGINVHTYTDLAFLRKYWVPDVKERRPGPEVKTIGFVLRDWAMDDSHYLDRFKLLINNLKSENIRCRVIILDQHGDKVTRQKFDSEDLLVWDPDQMNVDHFVSEMSSCSLIVSSRAHGAIGGACLGVPVMCYPIEPKLKRVKEMLGEAATLYEPGTGSQGDIFRDFLNMQTEKSDEIKKVVISNERKIEQGVAFLREKLEEKFGK